MDVDKIQLAYVTASAGMNSKHTLPLKIKAIADAGFRWIELAFPDLEAYTEKKFGSYKKIDGPGGDDGDLQKLLEAAKEVNGMMRELGLRVLTVMPFSQFEGYNVELKRNQNMTRAKSWLKILEALDCQMLQVGSSDDPDSSGDLEDIVRDLRWLADEAASKNPPVKIAYEMWSWGVHINSWEQTWEVCRRVDRPNFGLCLDTFQISATHYAPEVCHMSALQNGFRAPESPMTKSLENLTETLGKYQDKIFYFQISDAVRVDVKKLADKSKEQKIHPLYAWSNEFRPLPFHDEYRGFLPVMNVITAVLNTGWKGPWSYEVFYSADQSREDESVPSKWTRAAMISHQKILQLINNGP